MHTHITPNQGIWSSARNGLFVGLLVGLLSGLFVGLLFGLLSELVGGLTGGLTSSLFVGLIGWLFFGLFFGLFGVLALGGGAFIMHFVLRWFFWRAGSIPWNYPRFLDYAVGRILLRKVGGGYVFIHRLLLEYFASLDAASISNEVVKHM